jgi:hypothetical protein
VSAPRGCIPRTKISSFLSARVESRLSRSTDSSDYSRDYSNVSAQTPAKPGRETEAIRVPIPRFFCPFRLYLLDISFSRFVFARGKTKQATRS